MQSKYLGAVKHEQCVNSDEDEAYGYLTSAVDPHARLSRVDWHFLVGYVPPYWDLAIIA